MPRDNTKVDLLRFLQEALDRDIVLDDVLIDKVPGVDGKPKLRKLPTVVSKKVGQHIIDTIVKLATGYREIKMLPDGQTSEKDIAPDKQLLCYIVDRMHGKIPTLIDQDMYKGPDLAGAVGQKLRELAGE